MVSGTVSGFARSLGHYISFGITATLMIVVNVFIARGIKFRWGSCCQKYGPFILSMIAAPLICADLLRHVLNDTNVWPWCGDPSQQRGLFPRVNTSWTADCLFSSTQFICTIPCCVPGNNAAPPGWTGPEQDGMLPPYWPEYDQLNSSELARIGKETVAGGTLGQPDCNCLNCVPLEDENIWNLSPIGILFTIIFTYSGFTLLAISTMWNANILKKCGEMKEQWKKLRGMGKKKKGGLKQSIQQPLIGEGV